MSVVIFNNVDIPSFVKVTGITFSVLPSIDMLQTSMPRKYGNIDNGVKLGGKAFELSLLLLHDDKQSIQDQSDELAEWLKGDNWKPSKLTFKEQPNQYYLARVSNSVEVDDLFKYGQTTITFEASNPVKYTKSGLTHTSDTGTVAFNYEGKVNAVPTIVIKVLVPSTDIIIKHNQSQNTIKLNGNFQVGQTIVIDNNLKKVSLNNSVSMKLLDFTSKWIYVENGQNTITTTNKEGTVNQITVSYLKAD